MMLLKAFSLLTEGAEGPAQVAGQEDCVEDVDAPDKHQRVDDEDDHHRAHGAEGCAEAMEAGRGFMCVW
jgi:hypothetical protein